MKQLFTSDCHFYHRRICEFTDRPFANVDEMNDALIAQWNKQVQPDDDIYHLGDFLFGGLSKIENILSQLNGRKHFIMGNHDDRKHWSKIDKEKYNIAWTRDVADININGQHIVMCHYPFAIWNQSHRSSWNLHGHSHGSFPEQQNKQLDVGIDKSFQLYGEHRLFTFDDIKEYMDKKPVQVVDHHNSETN